MRQLVAGAIMVTGSIAAGCVSGPPASELSPYQLATAEIEAVKAGVAVGLKDPTSPIFGPLFPGVRQQGYPSIYVCGTVNAKNSFGAYIGLHPFFGRLLPADFPGSNGAPRFVVESIGGSADATAATYARCNAYRLAI